MTQMAEARGLLQTPACDLSRLVDRANQTSRMEGSMTLEGRGGPPLRTPLEPMHRRVLVVADDTTAAELIAAQLATLGCACTTPSDGSAAPAHVCEGRYDLVIIDGGGLPDQAVQRS